MGSNSIWEDLQLLLEEDNRVITYKLVSNTFNIHVNKAKDHLRALLDECRAKGDGAVTATYFLAGTCRCEDEDFTSLKVQLVTGDRLAAARAALTSVTSEHLYSLQRHRVCDPTVLYGADLQEQRADVIAYNRHGAITCKSAERIPEAELLKRQQTAVTSEPARVTSSGKPAEKPAPAVPVKKEVVRKGVKEEWSQKNEAKKELPEETEAKKETETKKETQNGGSKKSAAAAPPKRDATIASMFASAGAAKKNKTPPKKATNMMASFLKKGAENPAPPVVPEKKPSVKSVPEADSEDETKPEAAAAQKSVRFGAKKTASRAVVAKKRSDRGGKEARSKKRRRILAVASDSSGSSEDEGREEEPEPEPEPEPLPDKPLETGEDDTTVAPSAQSRSETDQPASKRRRKLVSKTFQDEEGFMVTKKVYESCSESDSEMAADKQAEPSPVSDTKPAAPEQPQTKPDHPKVSPPKKKQPGIMSFFKKK